MPTSDTDYRNRCYIKIVEYTCLTSHTDSISHHLALLIINTSGVDTHTQAHTHTHTHTHIHTYIHTRTHMCMHT